MTELRLKKIPICMVGNLLEEGIDGSILDFSIGLAGWGIPVAVKKIDENRQWPSFPADFRRELERIVFVRNRVIDRCEAFPVLWEVDETGNGRLQIGPEAVLCDADLFARAAAFGKFLQELPPYFDWENPE